MFGFKNKQLTAELRASNALVHYLGNIEMLKAHAESLNNKGFRDMNAYLGEWAETIRARISNFDDIIKDLNISEKHTTFYVNGEFDCYDGSNHFNYLLRIPQKILMDSIALNKSDEDVCHRLRQLLARRILFDYFNNYLPELVSAYNHFMDTWNYESKQFQEIYLRARTHISEIYDVLDNSVSNSAGL